MSWLMLVICGRQELELNRILKAALDSDGYIFGVFSRVHAMA